MNKNTKGDKLQVFFKLNLYKTGEYSLNQIYQGMHWTKRKRQADFFHNFVRSEIQKQKVKVKMFKKPVEINLYFNDRLDIDNHGYIAKLIIDSLKGLFIVDDTKKYIKKLTQEFYNEQGILVVIKEI